MRFEFSPRSRLYGRKVVNAIDRIVLAQDPSAGQKFEYIFCYRNEIPTKEEEPYLYKDAKVEGSDDKKKLSYPNLDEVVMLLTIEADERYRREHPKIIFANELFKIE